MPNKTRRFKEVCEGVAAVLLAAAKLITAFALFAFALSGTGWFVALAKTLGRLPGSLS